MQGSMPLKADQFLLHYHLMEKIGESEMAEVWRAQTPHWIVTWRSRC